MSTWVKFAATGFTTDDDTPGLTRRTLHSAAASFPQPVAVGGGGSIETWRDSEGYAPADVDLQILGTVAATLPGPLALYGERRDGVFFIGLLNNGSDIVLQSATVGFAQELTGVGTFLRLLLGGVTGTVTPTAGTCTVKATPLLVHEKRP